MTFDAGAPPLPRPLATLLAELDAGARTSRSLIEHALSRADDPAGEGPRVFLAIDRARALRDADAIDAARRAGERASLGPLAGLPVSAKDLFDVAGEVTRAGSALLSDAPAAERTAPAVERLRAAGAVLLGRTNMTEFAYSGLGINPHHGTPSAPFDRAARRIPGGSSSGAAVSVTDGMAAAALGTDTGGSIRIPAAFCGLVGLKPTARRVPMAGAFPLSPTLDSAGPLAPTVACCALLDAVLAGEPGPPVPAPRPLAGVRLAVPEGIVLEQLDDEVERAFARALDVLRGAGAIVTRIAAPELDEALQIQGAIAGPESFAVHAELLARGASRYDPRVRSRIRRGEQIDARTHARALAHRAPLIARAVARFAPHDAWLAPTVACVPPRESSLASDRAYGETNALVLRNTCIVNVLDGCALTLPVHRAGQAPVGLMVVGSPMTDRALLALGLAIEAALAAAR